MSQSPELAPLWMTPDRVERKQREQQMVEDYRSGMTFAQIAAKYGAGETTVRKHVRKFLRPTRRGSS